MNFTLPASEVVVVKIDDARDAHRIRKLRQRSPRPLILALVPAEDANVVRAVIEMGADGCLSNDAPEDSVTAAVELLRRGLIPICPHVAPHLWAALRERPSEPPPAALTSRETEVLSLLARGHSYSSIASALDIGHGTVQSHVKSIYRKLEVASKAEAASMALRYGLV